MPVGAVDESAQRTALIPAMTSSSAITASSRSRSRARFSSDSTPRPRRRGCWQVARTVVRPPQTVVPRPRSSAVRREPTRTRPSVPRPDRARGPVFLGLDATAATPGCWQVARTVVRPPQTVAASIVGSPPRQPGLARPFPGRTRARRGSPPRRGGRAPTATGSDSSEQVARAPPLRGLASGHGASRPPPEALVAATRPRCPARPSSWRARGCPPFLVASCVQLDAGRGRRFPAGWWSPSRRLRLGRVPGPLDGTDSPGRAARPRGTASSSTVGRRISPPPRGSTRVVRRPFACSGVCWRTRRQPRR